MSGNTHPNQKKRATFIRVVEMQAFFCKGRIDNF